MENMVPLTPEEMAQASGGAAVTVRLKTIDVRSGPSLSYPVIATLSSGVTLNTTGYVSGSGQDAGRWYMINKPAKGWVSAADPGI